MWRVVIFFILYVVMVMLNGVRILYCASLPLTGTAGSSDVHLLRPSLMRCLFSSLFLSLRTLVCCSGSRSFLHGYGVCDSRLRLRRCRFSFCFCIFCRCLCCDWCFFCSFHESCYDCCVLCMFGIFFLLDSFLFDGFSLRCR